MPQNLTKEQELVCETVCSSECPLVRTEASEGAPVRNRLYAEQLSQRSEVRSEIGRRGHKYAWKRSRKTPFLARRMKTISTAC